MKQQQSQDKSFSSSTPPAFSDASASQNRLSRQLSGLSDATLKKLTAQRSELELKEGLLDKEIANLQGKLNWTEEIL
jgi:hypothetical protein